MASINEFTDGRWDIADVTVTIDGTKPELYTSGDVFELSYNEDNIKISSDVYGNGITVINHNGQADLTLNLSRLDKTWQKMLEDSKFKEMAHEIVINTPVEIITTSSASLSKIPNLNSGTDAPTVALLFHCVRAKVSPQSN